MYLALITALGVGGATIAGVLIGFLFQKVPHRFNDIILGFAAGVMLGAAVLGLIIPSLEEGQVWMTLAGILTGALFLNAADYLTPHLHRITGMEQEAHKNRNSSLNKVMLFVMAIAIHNLPGRAGGRCGIWNRRCGQCHHGGAGNCSAEHTGRNGDCLAADSGRRAPIAGILLSPVSPA